MSAHLREAIARGLRQVQVARLVDDVVPVVPDLAVVKQVDRTRGARRHQASRRKQTAEHLQVRHASAKESRRARLACLHVAVVGSSS